MKSFLPALTLATVLFAAAPARATEVGYSRKLGVGLMLGDPTGFTGKYWVAQKNAIDFGLGFGFAGRQCDRYGCYGGYNSSSLNADYLWHPSVLARGAVELDWHIGVGARLWFWDWGNRYNNHSGVVNLSIRAPIGLDLMFSNPNFLEIYAEITPAIYFYDRFLGFEGGLGIRFYF